MTNDAMTAQPCATENESGPDAGPVATAIPSGAERCDSAHWAEFSQVYRSHLSWLLDHAHAGSNEADEAVKLSGINARAARAAVKTRAWHAQSDAIVGMCQVGESIDEALSAAGREQTWAWDRAMAMAADFNDSACSMAGNPDGIVARHVRYLAALARAQTTLLLALFSSAEGWEDDKPKEPEPLARLNGFSADQIQESLEMMVTNAESLRDFLMEARHRAEGEFSGGQGVPRVSSDLHLAQQSVSLIGAMADELAGGGLVGNALSWMAMTSIEPREGAHA